MQAGQRVIDRQKCTVRRVLSTGEVVGVLEILDDKEDAGEQHRQHQKQPVLAPVVQFQRRPRHDHRH
ncbi:hypothetical protein D3C83_133030 [compost metagenome]